MSMSLIAGDGDDIGAGGCIMYPVDVHPYGKNGIGIADAEAGGSIADVIK